MIKSPNCSSEITEKQLTHIHEQINQTESQAVTKLFKVLADPTRVKIAQALTIEDELCVCDVAAVTETSVATASHHLRTLRDHGLTKTRKYGKNSYYSLDDHHVVQLIQVAVEHQHEQEAMS